MSITWREREHEEYDMVSINDPDTMKSLRDCWLLKYFRLSGMRQHMELLQFLIHSWDPTLQSFHIGDKLIPILVYGIFFLTGLSRRGAPISLAGFIRGGETVKDYIRQFSQPETEPRKYSKMYVIFLCECSYSLFQI